MVSVGGIEGRKVQSETILDVILEEGKVDAFGGDMYFMPDDV